MSLTPCPRCGQPTEVVVGVDLKPGVPLTRCRACGWSSAGGEPVRGGVGWLLWFGVGVLPALAGPWIRDLGERWEMQQMAMFVLVFGGLVCCCLGGFGLARVLAREPLNRLVAGLLATGGLVLFNVITGLLAGCGRP